MREIIKIGCSCLLGISLASCASFSNKPPVVAAKEVNLQRFQGTWYGIASLPAFFQTGCSCVKSNYKMTGSNTAMVQASCVMEKQNKKLKQTSKDINVVPGSHGAKFKIMVMWPLEFSYWILYIDPDYQYALAGTPNRSYIWLLSRTPTMPNKEYKTLIKLAKEQGFEYKDIQKIPQNCSPSQNAPIDAEEFLKL